VRLRPASDLIAVVARLKVCLSPAAVPTEPFQMIVWENIGYLIEDARRRELFDAFERAVGFEPATIAAADETVLLGLARRGGMRPNTRLERWRTIARITLEQCGGDLDGALRGLPLDKARRLLKTFPVIGDPGADKVLLFAGLAARPCLESNALRSLARLGFFEEQASYEASYRSALAVLVAAAAPERDWLIDAHIFLRELGKRLCRRGEPLCADCPLDAICAHRRVAAL
jgi:endonuclease-3